MKRRKKRRLGASFMACLLVLSLILSTYGAKETVRADETDTTVELSADSSGNAASKEEKQTAENNQNVDQKDVSDGQTGEKEDVSDETDGEADTQNKDTSESDTSEEDSSIKEESSESTGEETSSETTGEEIESTETSEEGSSTEVRTDDEQTAESTETTASTETAPAMTKAKAVTVEEEEGFNPEKGGTLTAESGNATVSAEVPAGAFKEVVEMKVSVSILEAGSDNATLEAVRKSIEEDYDIFDGTLCSGAYVADISFENENGEKIQPKASVDITVTPAAAIDVDLTENASGIYTGAVYHIDDSSQANRLISNVELNDNHQITSMAFSSDSFSPFAAVVMNASNEKVISTNQSGKTFNVADGQVLMIEGTDGSEEPIVIENCTFNLSGKTVKLSGPKETDEGKAISYNNGETATKLFIGRNVTFNNCTFIGKSGSKSTSAGYDACVYFFSGDITLNNCDVTAQGWNGQFLGLYGSSGSVTFNSSNIATTGNKNGWSYAMYSGSVLKLNKSTMSAKGMTTDSGNINAFYSGDNRTGYDAIYFTESTVDFSDNKAGGFAINNVNIHVDNSDIIVNNNLGNACNSGYWMVTNGSSITMNGNRGGHGLSCIGIEMKDSSLEVLHNGYAGVYIQSRDSSFTNSNVNLRCNGEKLLSYSAGDLWLQGHSVTFNNCESVWLGGVGRTGSAVNNGCNSFVAFDLNELNGVKSNTSPVLTGEIDAQEEHTLFLNPDVYAAYGSDYARGSDESKSNPNKSNDMDLMEQAGKEKVTGKDTARIGTLTTAQLSHHEYDWEAGEITDQATETAYGVERYACTNICASYINQTDDHANSFDCEGTYVYTPLVGLAFDANVPEGLEGTVTGMPANQTEITYDGTATEPTAIPQRTGYTFAGWYKDPACTEEYDFNTKLTDNWTTVYAKWEGTGSLVVTKRTVDAFDEPLTLGEGATFYVQLFADEALTEKVGEKQPIVFDGTSSAAQVVFSKLENGTYYVAEVDEEDNIISSEQIGIYDGGEYYPMYPDGNAGILEGDTANAEISFNNVFLVLPQEYYKSIDLNITKQVRNAAGQPVSSDETFYAGIFTDEKYTQLAGTDLVEQSIVPITMNGSSDQTVTVGTGLFGNEETVKFYITEVNASGVPVGDDFGYIMTIQNGTLEMNGTSESQQITITNTVKTQGSTVTDENEQRQNGTGTDSNSGNQTNNNNNSSSSSSNNINKSTNASRTGDSTQIALYVTLLGICLVVAIVYVMRRRRVE